MKKSKLIKMLEAIPGDPDVAIWNGYVEDWQPLKGVEQVELVRETAEHLREQIDNARCLDGKPVLTDEEFRQIQARGGRPEWRFPNRFVRPEEFERWYGKKRRPLVLLEPGMRGKEDFDRNGSIKY